MDLLYTGLLWAFLSALLSYSGAQEEYPWCFIEDSGQTGTPIPDLPESYSMDIQLNFPIQHYSTEVTRTVDKNLNRSALEVFAGNRHVKYILLQNDNVFLTIDYKEKGASCSAKEIGKKKVEDLFADEDKAIAGTLIGLERLISSKEAKFRADGAENVKGIYVQQWTTCAFVSEVKDAIEATISFADFSWKPSHPVYPTPVPPSNNFAEPVEIEMHMPGKLLGNNDVSNLVIWDFTRILPFTPADEEFQPPEDVHCQNFRKDVKPPLPAKYFRYNAEVIVHTDATDANLLVSHGTVYYDYSASLARIDLQDPSTDNTDTTAPLETLVASVIRDFKAGIEYTIDPTSGSCNMQAFKGTSDVLGKKDFSKEGMLEPNKYFHLDAESISYHGQYLTRGMKTDVFSSLIEKDDASQIFHWYFTTDKVQLIEEQEVQRNVLVKMVIKPESAVGKKGTTEINFYNFVEEEPSIFTFDVASCYNETLSKTFILSFPGEMNPFMQESTQVLKEKVHKAIKDAIGVSQTRVSVQEVVLVPSHLYAQFKIVDVLPFGSEAGIKDISLNEAVNKLRTAISDGTLKISLPMKDNIVVVLRPELSGLKEYSKQEEKQQVVQEGFSQGSVGGLAFGMILLGFLMGGAVVNLIISRKHGVSLFQKAGFGTSDQSFNNPLNESSM